MRPLRIACNVAILVAITWGTAELWAGNTEWAWNDLRGVLGKNFVSDYFVTLLQILPLSILAAHFFIDSGVWRLSQPKQRDFVFSRLAFLRPAQSPPALAPSGAGRVQPAE